MSESGMRSSLVKRLAKFDAQSIECPIKSGVPDINFRHGWIECKYKDSFPKYDIVVKFGHPVTPGQKVWMRRRVRAGGRCFLAAKVGAEWFFWDIATFNLDSFNNMTKGEMVSSADLHYRHRIDDKELFAFLGGEE